MRRCRFLCVLPALLALAAAPAVPQALDRTLDIYFVDVEGGAATLTVLSTGESVLVDTGWPREDARDAKRIEHVARYVAGLRRIDHLVSTHWHTDHYGGVEALAKRMPVGRYWDRGIPAQASDGARDFPTLIGAYRTASGGRSTALQAGDTIPLRGTRLSSSLTVVASNGKVIGEPAAGLPESCPAHREAPVKDESDNKLSLALLLRVGRFEFLNCGDLTWNIEHKLACPRNRVGKVDLWQVTHHGANQSNNPALVQAIQPVSAVMCNGPRKGGHPDVVRLLKNTPSLEAFYQLHLNVTSGADDNADPTHIANLDADCSAEFVRVSLSPDGNSYTVYKGATRPLRTFLVR